MGRNGKTANIAEVVKDIAKFETFIEHVASTLRKN